VLSPFEEISGSGAYPRVSFMRLTNYFPLEGGARA
jgi:hypothetical protein